jgi:glycosyltransferase involved in cell wall biosynthesis
MIVVVLSELFAREMGYLENLFPKYLARMGVEAHVIATDLPLSYRERRDESTYKGFAQALPAGAIEAVGGCTLHILGHKRVYGHMRMVGLEEKLTSLLPDIVQTMTPIGWIGVDAALFRRRVGYKLFTGCHHHSSVFPLASKATNAFSAERLKCLVARTIPGRLASIATEKCYAISVDCADVAVRFFGVPRGKIEVCPLGVDTELFYPVSEASDVAEREALRKRMGFADGEIACIYSGRFSDDKNPLLLAKAVSKLRQNAGAYRGFFVGNGPQAEEIRKCEGCVTHEFVPVQELGAFYRAADIGVWPTQESLSMLDATACGLPIVANHRMVAAERIEGNGLTYILNDLDDLVRTLRIMGDSQKRQEMGFVGARRMARDFSWESVAKRRLADYEVALRSQGSFREAKQQGTVQ